MKTCDVILTGLPRSGTTLARHLLNKVPNVVALDEPREIGNVERLPERPAMCERISSFFVRARRSLLENGVAPSKQVGGTVPDNHASDQLSSKGLRTGLMSQGCIIVDKSLDDDFHLVVKHPHTFTALLEDLSQRFPCYAIVRNPLSVLASWNSVSFPVRKGRAPGAERIDGSLSQQLDQITDRVDRQFRLLEWFYGRYRAILPSDRVLRYEDIIETGGAALRVITPAAGQLRETIQSKNKNPLYDEKRMAKLGERLLRTDGSFWEFYSKESVEE